MFSEVLSRLETTEQALLRGELLPEGGVLQGEIDAAAEGAEKEQEEAGHGWASGDGDRKDNDRRQYEFWRATGYDSRARQFGSTYAITSR